ncbi:MAG: hypothetical protein IKE11_11470 [Clostridia bacterium]|jgi:hypothetical protein|nr:hypothetical protein [Clostridia bacterium]
MKEGMMDLCVIGGFTGLILLLFPSGTSGAAGRRAVSVCYLLECLRLLSGALKGG